MAKIQYNIIYSNIKWQVFSGIAFIIGWKKINNLVGIPNNNINIRYLINYLLYP